MIKKAKRKVDEYQWHVQLDCKVQIVKIGNFPDTVFVKLPDGKETQVDVAYLAKLKEV
ncbi:hypothetical protein UFOVP22_15 [uncultured Caudovirales phage]|uniref:Uncharacterized protein n=1 Tax=uncultured Caudovirales phage TaxID=2100421 RepID=A0A6J5TAG6_9CAUD|nr:hypothetical protein UFOVP22_15 [uncultured Caudovirales phage]